MALKNDEKKELYLKLVYCGPDDSTKADNLLHIHKKLNPVQRGEIINLEPEGVRFFDFYPPNIPEIGGFKTVFHLYMCPGSSENKAVTKHVLRDADGIVFVADSNPAQAEKNLESMKELGFDLSQLKISIDAVPFVFQYNREDAAAPEDTGKLEASLNVFEAPFVKAETGAGKGVLETFTQISKLVIKSKREAPDLSSVKRADDDGLLLELVRIKTGKERQGLDVPDEESGIQLKAPEVPAVTGEEETATKGGVLSEDSMAQYAIGIDDLSAEKEKEKIPEGIEIEPGFELEGDENFGEEPPGIELEVADEEAADELEAAQDVTIPEGIEMEPGFELEDEEVLGADLTEEEEALIGDEIEDIEDLDLPEGIEMETAFTQRGEIADDMLSDGPVPPESGESEVVMDDELDNELSSTVPPPLEETGEKEAEETEHALSGKLEAIDDLGIPDDMGVEPDLGLNNGERLRPIQDEPHGLGEKEVEEAGQVDIPELSAVKSAGEEAAAPEFMQTPAESGEKEGKAKSAPKVSGGEISEPVATEILDEIKASIGKPFSQGGGLFSIPLVLGSGKEEKTFNLKISIMLEELQPAKAPSLKVEEQVAYRTESADTAQVEAAPVEDASFLDEVEDVKPATKSQSSEVKLDIKPHQEEKKGFFASLFSRKK